MATAFELMRDRTRMTRVELYTVSGGLLTLLGRGEYGQCATRPPTHASLQSPSSIDDDFEDHLLSLPLLPLLVDHLRMSRVGLLRRMVDGKGVDCPQ